MIIGNGMSDLSKSHTKLKEENKRLSVAIDQMTAKLGMSIDMNNILSQSFDRLKQECGKPLSFMYPEYELHQQFTGENSRLRSQILVLEEQISGLEAESSRLRHTLKDQMDALGEKGFQYHGLAPEELVAINDFARNIREGKVDLPLNDRSQALLKENQALKEDLHVIELKLERYEREFPLATTEGGRHAVKSGYTDNTGGDEEGTLKSDIQRLLNENNELQSRVMSLQQTLTNEPLLITPAGQGMFDIATLLHRNSSSLLPTLGPHSSAQSAGSSPLLEPSTAQGKAFLQANLLQLNLPPEEWTSDVIRIYKQLIQCLEEIYIRDEELDENKRLIDTMETTLLTVKQHNAALYYDFSLKCDQWKTREEQYKQQSIELHAENDDYKRKLTRIQDIIDLIQRDDPSSLETKLTELNRKLLIYEVNEATLSRKYTSLQESYTQENIKRIKLETDFIEMETVLKKRVLYLEERKAHAVYQLGLAQTRAMKSIPQVSIYV